jgi:hypothetical protein
MSDYVGAGGDSIQPDLQPRPEQHADRLALVGDQVASLAVDWPSRTAEVRLAPQASPNDATDVIDLTEYARRGELDGDGGEFFRRFDRASLFVRGSDAVVVLPTDVDTDVIVYETGAEVLELAAHAVLPFGAEGVNLSVSERKSPPMAWPRVALVGEYLVFQARRAGSATFELVDLRTLDQARSVSVARGNALETGPVRELDGMAVSERRIKTPGESGEFSYVLDRIDLRNPDEPEHRVSLNVPGPVIAASSDGQRLVTIGYERAVVQGVTTCCPGAGGCGGMIDTCEVTRERISLVELGDDDSVRTLDELVPDVPLGLNAVTANGRGAFGSAGLFGPWPLPEVAEVVFLGDLDGDDLELSRQSIDGTAGGGDSIPFMAQNETHVALPVFLPSNGEPGIAMLPATPDGSFGTATVTPLVRETTALFWPRVADLAITADTLFVATNSNGIQPLPLP